MTHSLQTYASALRAMGFGAFIDGDDDLILDLPTGKTLVLDMDDPRIEAAVRSAVLKIAPWSFAQPSNQEEGKIVVWTHGDDGQNTYAGGVFADTYTEAWLNACVALVEAGMVPA